MNSEGLWSALREALRNKASEAMWAAGLSSLRLVDYSNGVLTISLPNQIQLIRVQQKYLPFITAEAQLISGQPTVISLVVSAESAVSTPTVDVAEVAPVEETGQETSPVVTSASDRPLRLNKNMTFDSFVEGPSNRLARAAAIAAAETPGRAYNPLMMYGNSGLGKTHLLHAIGNYIQENYPYRKVLYVSTETFLNDFIRAIQTRTQLALHELP